MSAVAVRAGAFLHHLQLQGPKPEKLAAFYGDAMDMSVEKLPDGRWHCFGRGSNSDLQDAPAVSLVQWIYPQLPRQLGPKSQVG